MRVIVQDKNQCILRFDQGEEVLSGLKAFAQANKITAAWFNGLGAAAEVDLYYYSISAKKYENKVEEPQNLEILSLTGNIGVAEGEPVVHCHGVFSDYLMQVLGGHVNRLVVSVTCELFLYILNGEIVRELNKDFNLKLMK